MREFRKKQKRLYKIMKPLVIISAIFIFAYIGVEPFVASWNNVAAMVLSYVCDILVVINMIIIFTYYSKYGKSDSFLSVIEYELADNGFYYTAREEQDEQAFVESLKKDFISDGYKTDTDVEINEFDFEVTAMKKKEFFYVANIKELSRNDILAYLDSVITDITVINLKKSGNAVLCFVTDNAEEDAIALSKMITPLGKKEKIKIALCIVEPNSKKCYFLGNMLSKCQQMVANYILRCDIPISDKYKGDKRLPFQDRLEERMKDFNIKDFKNGTFYAH